MFISLFFQSGSDQKSSTSEADRKSSPDISLRLETGPSAKRYSLLAAENGFLQCQVTDLTSEFLTSTLANIRHFVEDDSVAEVMPMKIKVQKVRLQLQVNISTFLMLLLMEDKSRCRFMNYCYCNIYLNVTFFGNCTVFKFFMYLTVCMQINFSFF